MYHYIYLTVKRQISWKMFSILIRNILSHDLYKNRGKPNLRPCGNHFDHLKSQIRKTKFKGTVTLLFTTA